MQTQITMGIISTKKVQFWCKIVQVTREKVMAQIKLFLDNNGNHILTNVPQIGNQKWFGESKSEDLC